MRHAVIVAMGRSAIGKAGKGSLRYTRPEDLGTQVMNGILAKIPALDRAEIDDVIVGCAFPEAEQGYNFGRILAYHAGMELVPGQTVNRLCSSGLQTIAHGANAIVTGQADVIVAGGVESMSIVPIGGNISDPVPGPDYKMYTPMGITAENVAEKYHITRQQQDAFSLESHHRAAAAQEKGIFQAEIIPVAALEYENHLEKRTMFSADECIRKNTSMEALAKLRPVFRKDGCVTAGNSSPTSDGASFAVLMEEKKAEKLGLKPIARLISFAVVGVPPELMGIGPLYAIPKLLKRTKMKLSDIDLIELNEAFAAQAVACIQKLGLDPKKVNVNGGAIALGHPLGCTGALLTTKLIHELQREKKARGIVSMCVGGGMGAAGMFELC